MLFLLLALVSTRIIGPGDDWMIVMFIIGMMVAFIIPLIFMWVRLKRFSQYFWRLMGFKNNNIELRICANKALGGYSEDQYKLARRYDYGFDLQQDKYLAIEWYKLAAEQEHKQAQLRLVELCNELADYIF